MKKIFSLKIDNVVIGLLVFATLASGGILASAGVKADDTTVVDEITVMIPVACSMSGTVTSAHTDTVTAVSYTEDIGVTDLKVTCNDFNGFSIYAVGFTDNTEGTTTMRGASSNLAIPTGVYHEGDTTSSWAMKLTKVTNPGGGDPDITYNPNILSITNGYSDYNVVPSSLTQVAEYKDSGDGSSATDQTLGAHVQTTYAAYVSGSQAADTYTGQVKYVLVHPADFATGKYSIVYNANGGAGTMASESNVPNYEPHIIPASTITPPSGYVLAGWCTVRDSSATAQNPQTTCTGTSYSDAIPASEVAANTTLNLYAYWRRPTLYETVAAMSKGKQTNDNNATTGIQAGIVAPTEAAPISSNSGVYEYNTTVFGADSDATNSSGGKDTIYYYRGILDSYGNTGTYGSDGLADAYPNYVILDANGTKDTSDTCWRIVRTTGSGGVKMIYNGKWTGSTCANVQTNAQVTTSAFNGGSATNKQMVRVGYTYNSTYATDTAKSGTIAQIFGTNSTSSVNNTRSTIKEYIEDTWYASNMTAYTRILEPSAGYCNDRTMNTTTGWTTPLTEDSTIAATYGASGLQVYYFGAYIRNMNSAQKPSLTCAKYSNVDRSTVDLYRYNGTNNAAGSTTANYLKYPAALLTTDELSFAGSGSSASNGSPYHDNSFLRSGNIFWLLSPFNRSSNGYANEFGLISAGRLSNLNVSSTSGVRPAISLKPGTTAASGTGIATDPWVVTAP